MGLLFKAATNVAVTGALKTAFGGGGRRFATGTLAGIGIGAATSDRESSTGIFTDAVTGGLIGAGIGTATTRTFGALAKGIGRLPHTIRAAKAARGMGAGPFEALSFGRYTASRSSPFKNISEAVRGGLNVGMGEARKLGGAALGIGSFAIRNPKTTAALAGAGVGMSYFMGTRAQDAGVDAATMEQLSAMSGDPSTGYQLGMSASKRQSRLMFQDSTNGLVFGLHSGRH